jgi:hypothetical protein
MKWFNLLMIPIVVVLVILFIPFIWENANLNPSADELTAGKITLGISAILLLIDLFVIKKLVEKHRKKELNVEDNLWMWLTGTSLLFLSVLMTSFVMLMPTVGWIIISILIGAFPILFIAAIIKIKIDEHKQSEISNQ